ncbi:Myosin-binding protein 7 [Nymphaea thermarum]|nr:Myosin-binding protein 7 [Nymphaea thermarum]
MDLQSPLGSSNKCCTSSCSLTGSSKWHRAVKRKVEQIEELLGHRGDSVDDLDYFSVARIEIENECMALRETVNSQQKQIQDLCSELDEERNASASAANEAMSMILRLQREKAEVQMEARQFKRFTEEKMAHDQQELLSMEDTLYKKDQLIQSLNCEIQAYKHRLMSLGFDQFDFEDAKLNEGSSTSRYNRNRSIGEKWENADWQETEESNRSVYSEGTPLGRGQKPNLFEYPPLRCSLNGIQEFSEYDDSLDLEKYVSGETPRNREQLQNLEDRIYRLEHLDGKFNYGENLRDKGVATPSPRRSRHARNFSTDSASTYSVLVKEAHQECIVENVLMSGPREGSKRLEEYCANEDYFYSRNWSNASELADDPSDRIYTIDSVHGARGSKQTSDEKGGWMGEPVPHRNRVENASYCMADGNFRILQPDDGALDCKPQIGKLEEYVASPRGSLKRTDMVDGDVKKLYLRLQALEADRESMRQSIMSMQTDKAQLILLREIAQQLCKELTPEKKMVKKPSLIERISFMSVLKKETTKNKIPIWSNRKQCGPYIAFG